MTVTEVCYLCGPNTHIDGEIPDPLYVCTECLEAVRDTECNFMQYMITRRLSGRHHHALPALYQKVRKVLKIQ